jgi:hypothetical protein
MGKLFFHFTYYVIMWLGIRFALLSPPPALS